MAHIVSSFGLDDGTRASICSAADGEMRWGLPLLTSRWDVDGAWLVESQPMVDLLGGGLFADIAC